MKSVALIGVGPRGLSVLERISANAANCTSTHVVVHMIEPKKFGSGEVWRTDQSPHLIMNIVASQITAFTDNTVQISGPLRNGPSLYAWAQMLAAGTIPNTYPREVFDEAVATSEDSYTRRSFYGHYLEWVYEYIVSTLPPNVSIREHRHKAVSVSDVENGSQAIGLDDGSVIVVNELMMATGHGEAELSAEEKSFHRLADSSGGRYYPPANPADVDLDHVAPGETVLLRGMGLCFFDYMALFTLGRGGEFVRDAAGTLRYLPSGNEPLLVCGSRRGVPLHGRASNEKGDGRVEPNFLTEGKIHELRLQRANGKLDFQRDCWPLIAKEVETTYYTRLVAARSGEAVADEFRQLYSAAPWSSELERIVLDKFEVPEDLSWDWERVAHPFTGADTADLAAWQGFIRDYLTVDVREAQQGNTTSPLKAAVDVLRDIRNELRFAINNGGIEAESYRRHVKGEFNSLHAFLSIGPPWSRIEELGALIDAGIVQIAGPRFRVECDFGRGTFVGTSDVPGEEHRARVLVDAMLPPVDLTRTKNRLLSHLRQRGEATRFSVPSTSAEPACVTGGAAVTQRPYRLVRANGTVHSRRYLFGVPTEGANWVTETGIRPKVNSITLGDSDAIARAILGLRTRPARDVDGSRPELTIDELFTVPVGASSGSGPVRDFGLYD
ncbi:FAD/NAD(P)-binding protein [Streptacidiphilus fuscans]|uniref:FAD/NAD(P)-binding protein n=1 Tax=Streptacidiphilus fuscans TaxID=2789292 RepID=A0A931B6A5_9ACTN|nr:FAD/NAD(P)-binding protein [Streptacidiphilus fuscans]MBF9067695.1 FAD/NAD(P)-binding protein [Streptacidiphilus fuscans]